MEGTVPKPGDIVISRAGRDAGRHLMVCEILGDGYALLCDGDLRRLSSPKRKKLKHTESTGDSLSAIADKLKDGSKVFDAELRSALAAYTAKET